MSALYGNCSVVFGNTLLGLLYLSKRLSDKAPLSDLNIAIEGVCKIHRLRFNVNLIRSLNF